MPATMLVEKIKNNCLDVTMPTQVRDRIGPVFHIFVFIHHMFTMIYCNNMNEYDKVTDERVLELELFAPVYFTSWNMVIQTIYFLLAIVYDILHLYPDKANLQKKIQLYKGYIFTSLVFPCSLFVSAMFWSVYTINRDWVLPEVMDDYVPEWVNHSMHTNIVIFTIIEVLIVNQLLPTFKSAFLGLTILSAIYNVVFFIIYFCSGKWIYGIFYILSWPERIALTFFNFLLHVFVLKIGIKIQNFKHSLVRRPSVCQKQK